VGSIPGGVTGIFHWHNASGRTMTLGLTQPLTGNVPGTHLCYEYQEYFLGVKAADA
jgi:hypothetical protein